MNLFKQIALAVVASLGVSACATSPDLLAQAEAFADNFPVENNSILFEGGDFSRTIYVDPTSGDDSNSGTSQKSPIKSLERLSQMEITGGDEILLRGGETHLGTIELKGLNQGASSQTIHIGSYGEGKAKLDFRGYPAGILVENSSDVIITDLKITANGALSKESYMVRESDLKKRYRYAIFVNSAGEKIGNISIDNVDIADVYYFNVGDENTPTGRPCHEWSTNGELDYGWGIRAFSRTQGSGIDNLKITNCQVRDVSHTAIKVNANKNSPITNMLIEGCVLLDAGGPGAQFSGVMNSVMRGCKTVNSGSRNEPRKWGRGSGMWLVQSVDFLFEKNYYEGAQGIADCCGAHIDIGNESVIVQYCVSKNNCGGFVEILGENKNCAYRYNISINDGWRNVLDEAQDEYWMWKQEVEDAATGKTRTATIGTNGCLITVNGHTSHDYVGPYQNYIYNNTIVCTPSRADGYTNAHIFELATSATGILVQNNIFWVPTQMKSSRSGHWLKEGKVENRAYDFRVGEIVDGKVEVRDLTEAEIEKMDFVVKNNLYQLYDAEYARGENVLPYNVDAPESKNRYYDANPLGGDPAFRGAISESMSAEDLIPTNASVVNQGMKVVKLSSDKTSYGVLPQLEMEYDFFGRKITTPIVGACVAQ